MTSWTPLSYATAHLLLTLVTVVVLASGLKGADRDWPQFLGPDRNGVYDGPPLLETWGAGGPRVVWRKQVGQGFSGPVVVENRVILFHRVENREVIEAFDARSGASEWQYGYPTTYRDDFGFDEGPRAVLWCQRHGVHLRRRRPAAAIDLAPAKRFGAKIDAAVQGPKGFLERGLSLVEDGRVWRTSAATRPASGFRCQRGRSCGRRPIRGEDSSATGATLGGRRLAVFLTRAGLVGLDPANGMVQFQRRWRARMAASVNAATPVVIGDLLFVSAQYGPGAAVMRVEGSTLTDLWSSDDVLSNHYATSVYVDGHLYGFHGRQEFGPSFRAVEFRTGKVRWSQDQFRAGSVTLAGNRLLILREGGELVLAAASPDAFRPVARAQILPATVRAYPAIADGFLYVRNENPLVGLDSRR